ncbi:MAG: ABC transporter substrate-binding protein [Pseudomonadota bacterium]|nr:ABC transporter substrate-binding protein [Pseudomonadota bacterium]
MIRRILILGLMLWPLAVGATGPTPTAKVRATVDEILIVLRDRNLDWAAQKQRIEPIVDRAFDFRSMSQSVLATHWKTATPAERTQFVDYFSSYLQETYMERIQNYSDEYVRYGKENINKRGDRASVDTFIVANGKEIPVTYRLRKNGAAWFSYDVVIEGQSLVRNYRDVYSAIIRSEGIGGLLDDLRSGKPPPVSVP